MKYDQILFARFRSRPNRFIALVELDGREETVHVKNTGRCKELLLPGVTVALSVAPQGGARKTKYDLVAVKKRRPGRNDLWVNMDSQIVNGVAEEWLRSGTLFSPRAVICRERTYGSSRFDFYVEDGPRKAFVEVKGVTLESDGVACFPDAPTLRGVKHLKELVCCRKAGYEAYVLFVIQMKEIAQFRPNDSTHPAFGAALRAAAADGVRVLALDCTVTPHSIVADAPVEIVL